MMEIGRCGGPKRGITTHGVVCVHLSECLSMSTTAIEAQVNTEKVTAAAEGSERRCGGGGGGVRVIIAHSRTHSALAAAAVWAPSGAGTPGLRAQEAGAPDICALYFFFFQIFKTTT